MVWLKWMELRVHGEVGAIKTPTGYIPHYKDLEELFQMYRNKDYTRMEYDTQFTTRVPELLEKIDRISKTYRKTVDDTPQALFDLLEEQRTRLIETQRDIVYQDRRYRFKETSSNSPGICSKKS